VIETIPGKPLARTPLYRLHLELGARMVPFAGYEMPVQYPTGIIKEHLHTRSGAGLFDVSHMGQVRLAGAARAKALESLVPVDVIDLGVDRQRYAVFTNDAGCILDDLMIANFGDHLLLIVNAACKREDVVHLRTGLRDRCEVEELADRALLALQGPSAGAVLARLAPETEAMVFMSVTRVRLVGASCQVSRSGYTGEDGFEISVPAESAEALARLLLAQPEVMPIGLGPPPPPRLEAGLCLYGQDIDTTTTPVEAGLAWALSKVRRADGARPGGYPGAAKVMQQLVEGVSSKRVGLKPTGRVPVRAGTELVDATGKRIGRVTSGGFGPSVGASVAMGYVEAQFATAGMELQAIVRGQPVATTVVPTPFVQTRYKRR
jgi:aminomethyltransferase